MRHRTIAAALIVAGLVAAGCSKGASTGGATSAANDSSSKQQASRAAPVTVTFANTAIDHPAQTVPVGTTVVWTNAETTALPHNVTSGRVEGTTPKPDGGFASAPLFNPGEKYEHTFTAPGTYHYYCSVHPAQMQGTITVG